MFLEEVDHVTTFPAAETLVYPLGRGNSERTRFFVMKRAHPPVLPASFREFHVFPDDTDDIGRPENSINYFLCYCHPR